MFKSTFMDPLSQILHLLKFDVSVYHNAKVCGNWRIAEHKLGSTCFHIVMTGNLLLDVPGLFKGMLNSGDLVIFPRELSHTMTPVAVVEGEQRHLDYLEAANIDGTGLLCASVQFRHQGSRYLLDALPPAFVIRYDPSNYWLKSLLDIFLAENLSAGPASKVIFDRLSELLFIYAFRQYLNEHPSEVGMLGLYSHARLARVVAAIHEQPEREWTLDEMAQVAAMSRTAFAEKFKSVSGWTAGQYVTWWRMQLAWSMLSDGKDSAEVASRVGYKSESAFSRIFRKTFDVTAGKVRKASSRQAA